MGEEGEEGGGEEEAVTWGTDSPSYCKKYSILRDFVHSSVP